MCCMGVTCTALFLKFSKIIATSKKSIKSAHLIKSKKMKENGRKRKKTKVNRGIFGVVAFAITI